VTTERLSGTRTSMRRKHRSGNPDELAQPGFGSRRRHTSPAGLDEARAASAYEHWVGSEGLSFRGRDDEGRIERDYTFVVA
jgi:hypothetical protein